MDNDKLAGDLGRKGQQVQGNPEPTELSGSQSRLPDAGRGISRRRLVIWGGAAAGVAAGIGLGVRGLLGGGSKEQEARAVGEPSATVEPTTSPTAIPTAQPTPTPDPQQSPLVAKPADTTAFAQPGGTLRLVQSSEAPSFDPLTAAQASTSLGIAAYAYPRMFKYRSSTYPAPITPAVEGDLIESWEFTADRLQLNLKLRGGLKWDSRPPTGGRVIDAEDLAFTWRKFSTASPFRANYADAAAPGSIGIRSITALDARTVRLTMARPNASLLPSLAYSSGIWVLPRESDGGFDPKTAVRGHGPYTMSSRVPGVSHTWTRNPDYYQNGLPYVETIEAPLIPEYAQRLAQLRAGAIYTTPVNASDVLPAKMATPALMMYQGDGFTGVTFMISFGYEGSGVFRDERVRQAVSMLVDRRSLADALSDKVSYEKAGVYYPLRYNSPVTGHWDGYWLDPMDEGAFGPNSRFYGYNPSDARALLAAAGLPDGIDTSFIYNAGNEYGRTYTRTAEELPGMLAVGGIRAERAPKPYVTDFLPNFANAYVSGKTFDGIVFSAESVQSTVALQLRRNFHKGGARFLGMSPEDPTITSMLDQIALEFDLTMQQTLVQNFARYAAEKAFVILPGHVTSPFALSWPTIANFGVYRAYGVGNPIVESQLYWWLDASRPPLVR